MLNLNQMQQVHAAHLKPDHRTWCHNQFLECLWELQVVSSSSIVLQRACLQISVKAPSSRSQDRWRRKWAQKEVGSLMTIQMRSGQYATEGVRKKERVPQKRGDRVTPIVCLCSQTGMTVFTVCRKINRNGLPRQQQQPFSQQTVTLIQKRSF